MDTLLFVYLCLVLLHLSMRVDGCKPAGDLTKVLLMPTLALYVLTQGAYPLLVASLACATVGDACLTKGRKTRFFAIGMWAFATCHVLYSAYIATTYIRWLPALAALLILLIPYGFFLKLLKGHHHAIRYALYAANLVILTSLCVGSGTILAIFGALAFLLSDAMIVLTILDRPIGSTVSEMAAYTVAQLALVLGLLHL